MGTKIFVNLPVKDLDKSIEFFAKLGFTFNPQFTNQAQGNQENRRTMVSCMVEVLRI